LSPCETHHLPPQTPLSMASLTADGCQSQEAMQTAVELKLCPSLHCLPLTDILRA